MEMLKKNLSISGPEISQASSYRLSSIRCLDLRLFKVYIGSDEPFTIITTSTGRDPRYTMLQYRNGTMAHPIYTVRRSPFRCQTNGKDAQ